MVSASQGTLPYMTTAMSTPTAAMVMASHWTSPCFSRKKSAPMSTEMMGLM